MKHILALVFLFLGLVAYAAPHNPVIRQMADCGTIRYAGKYYLGGLPTDGSFLVSPDLVHWTDTVHVYDFDTDFNRGTGAQNNQVHACDMCYVDGTFHLIYSANYWGHDRHIVHAIHAVADTITGPYREVRPDQWMENRIDPMVFRDEDGRLYFYIVKFTDGNTIWGRGLNPDFSFSTEPVWQFSSQPGTWETQAARVAEGPYVIKYRCRYYMMYNANHTSPQMRAYRLGVCEADNPLHFQTGGKYSAPVVGPASDRTGALPTDTLLTPGQPTILRGPNGWEWWLVYMANMGPGRHQFVDRVHFVNNRLTVDGITGPDTPGFHPAPALPQYSGTTLPDSLASSYLLEVTFPNHTPNPWVRVNGTSLNLPKALLPKGAFAWRIEKNADHLTAWADNVLIADTLLAPSASQGVELSGPANYISYNEGWDEYGSRFSGWDGLTASDAGMSLPAGSYLKGPEADDYEFSTMFSNADPAAGEYGIYAYWADPQNYVRFSIDAPGQTLKVEQMASGRRSLTSYPVADMVMHYPDIKYTDSFEKQYRFDSPTVVDAIELPRRQAGRDPYGADLGHLVGSDPDSLTDMAATQQIAWLDAATDTWHPLEYTEGKASHQGWQRLDFAPVRTTALRFINSEPTDENRHIYRIATRRGVAALEQLRARRMADMLHLFLGEREVAQVPIKDARPSRIGLYSDGKAPVTVVNDLYFRVF